MSDWSQRQLCSNGACVGVVGNDGLCSTCGLAAPGWGSDRQRGLKVPVVRDADADADDEHADDEHEDDDFEDEDDDFEDEDEEYDDDEDSEDDDEQPAASNDEPVPEASWQQRALCSDGACVGVILASGRCSVCRKTP